MTVMSLDTAADLAADEARAADLTAPGAVRAAAGVCPCCNRHFENVQRHMSTKHPDFTASDDA